MDKEVTELIGAIHVRCEQYMFNEQHQAPAYFYPTLLEDLYHDAQIIIDLYCVEDMNEDSI